MESYPFILDFSAVDRMTDAQFIKFCADNPNLNIERNSDGTITLMSPSGFKFSYLSNLVATKLTNWCLLHSNGMASDGTGGFKLPDNAIFAPDVAWISNDRLQGMTEADLERFLPACPNFVVEVLSPSDSLEILKQKMMLWLKNGVELAWLINPRINQVIVYRKGETPKIVEGFDTILYGDPFLPGFEFDLKLLQR